MMATIFSEMKKYHRPPVAAACSGPAVGQAGEEALDVAERLGLEVVLAGVELGAQRVAADRRAVGRHEVELLAGVRLVVGLDVLDLTGVLRLALVEELLEPELEVEHPPDRHRVDRVRALDPALEGVQHRGLVEVGPVGEGLGEELAVDVVLEAHEPLALRGRRADLVAAVDDGVGQQPTHRVAEDPLADAVLDEGVVAEAEDEADEVAVDERHPHGDAEAAGVLVGVAQPGRQRTGEDVVGEPGPQVGLLDRRSPRRRGRARSRRRAAT